MKIQWVGRLVRKNGALRKHILSWSIPKKARESLGLPDGLSVDLTLDLGGSTTRFRAPLFSGGEFKIPEELRSALTAHQSSGGSIRFELSALTDANGESFQREVRQLSSLTDSQIKEKLPPPRHKPKRVALTTSAFIRSTHLVNYTLRRANGKCEACGKTPFKRFQGGEVYLEVHHIVPLALGGYDGEENVMALCPECHRFAHFGDPKKWDQILKTFFKKSGLSDPRPRSAQTM
jgi:hypothetical protein